MTNLTRRQRVDIKSPSDLQAGDILVHMLDGHENRYPCRTAYGNDVRPFYHSSATYAWIDEMAAMIREGAYVLREVKPLPDDTPLASMSSEQIVKEMGEEWRIGEWNEAIHPDIQGGQLSVWNAGFVYYRTSAIPGVKTLGQLRKLQEALEGK